MRKLLALLAIAFVCAVQDSSAQNVEGQLIASQYQYLIAGYAPNTFSWPGGTCNASGPQKQFAFAVGAPITIVDGNPALTETVTPMAVLNNNQICAISIAALNNHQVPFSIKSATGGLQEALNLNVATPATNTVILNSAWYQSVGSANATAVIAAAKGSAQLNLVDVTTTPYNWYAWNGSQYVLTTIAGQSLATYNVPGLQGGGRCFVYPSMITTDAFALINSCSSQLPAQGGLIDATALGTANYPVTTQLTALNNANQAVVLLLNPGTTFTINTSFTAPTNTPASCAVPVGPASQPNGGSAIIVPGKNSFGGFTGSNFILGPSARVWDVICNGNFTGDQETLKLDGVYVMGNQSATMMGAQIHLAGVFTPTSIINSGTRFCFGQCLEVDAGTTGTGGAAIGDLLFENDLFQDSYSGSATYPGSVVNINTLTNSGQASNINFVGGMIQLNGPHNPLLTINGHGGYQADSIGFLGTTFQGAPATTSGANPSVDPIQLTDVSSVLITNLRFRGATTLASQANLVDINGTVQNAQFGINIDQPTVFTGAFACIVKNNVEGTCAAGWPNGIGITAMPNYTYGQFFPQIRQESVAPPTTPGQCVVGSIWTNSSATTAANAALICAGTPGNQVYVSFGGGGGGGGGFGTPQNALVGNNAGNTAAISLNNYLTTTSPSFTEQQAINAAFTNVGVATLMPQAIPVPFTNLNDASVVDLEHPSARVHSITEWGAQCNTRLIQLSFSSGSNLIAITNGFFFPRDVGKTITAVGTVGGIPAAWEPKITAMGSGGGPGYATAVMDTNAPFAQAAVVYAPMGNDDTAGMTTAFQKAAANGYTLKFPSSGCFAHNLTNTGISLNGIDPKSSQWFGFPGENLLTLGDPSQGTATPNNGTAWSDFSPQIDNRIDATKAWQIIDVSGTHAKTAVYQPTGIKTPAANNPLGQGWFIGPGANGSGAIVGVGAINSGSPTLMTVPGGVNLPVAAQKIVFPYLTTIFTTTVASVNTGTRVVTLNASYPGSTGTQIVWFAGTSVQTLAASYSGSGCPATMTLTNPIIPSLTSESNVAPFGLVQVDAEQFSYFGRTGAGAPGTQFLSITGCAQNGTSRAAHSSAATIVPLNPFKPATPWPVTPSINAGFTTPLLAAYYPAWNVGNAFFAAPVANGATGTFGVDSFANADIGHLNIQSSPTTDPFNNTTPFYLVSLPYSTHFHDITVFQTTFGPEEGTPTFNSGSGWASAQPTADGTHWDGIRISSCNVMNMIAGNQNSYRDFNVYSSCEPTPGTFTGANTCWYFGYGWNDQTGGGLSFTDHTHFSNMYCEPEAGSQDGLVPAYLMDGFVNIWDDMHMGGGGETYIGGVGNHWRGGNFNNQFNFPVLDYGVGNGSDFITNLGSGTIGNVYGTNTLIEYGQSANWLGTINQPNGSASGPYGPNGLFGREPIPNQTNETFNTGNVTAPFVSSDGGYIPAYEFNSVLTSYEAQAFQIPPYYDPASFSGWSVGCNVGTVGVGCLSYKFNQEGVFVGPGERIAAGKNTLWIQSKSSGSATSYQLQLGVGTPDNVGNYTIPVSSSYTWTKIQNVDFTGLGGGGAGIALGFANASSADTITVGAVDFAPVWQEPAVNNLDIFNQVIDSTGSKGTSGFVWTSTGSGSPNHWAASAGGISGGTTNALPKYSSATALIPSLWTDNGTTTTYSGTGGIAVTAATPGKFSLVAGTGSIPALAANSWGFAAPNTGGTAALVKPPATMTKGFWFAAAPGTNDGVNESALSMVSTEFILDGDMGLYGGFASGTLIKSAKMSNAGHFVNLEVANISSASCTGAPTINVYDLTASTSGTGLVGSTTGTSSGTILDGAQTLAFNAGDQIAIKVQTTGSACTSSEFSVTATVSEP